MLLIINHYYFLASRGIIKNTNYQSVKGKQRVSLQSIRISSDCAVAVVISHNICYTSTELITMVTRTIFKLKLFQDVSYTNHVSVVTFKISPFWTSNPQIWFAQFESQFSAKGITAQKTKFEHIITSLAPEVAQEVLDLILSPPISSPYNVLKSNSCNVPLLQSNVDSTSYLKLKSYLVKKSVVLMPHFYANYFYSDYLLMYTWYVPPLTPLVQIIWHNWPDQNMECYCFHRGRAIAGRDSRPQKTSIVIAHLQSITSALITLPMTITWSFTIYTKQRVILVSSTFWKLSTYITTTLQLVWKRVSQPLVAASVTCQSQSHLFYSKDHNSGLHLLADTGTEVSEFHLQILNANTNKMDLHYKQLITLQSRLMVLSSSHSISASVENFDSPSLQQMSISQLLVLKFSDTSIFQMCITKD